MKQKIDDDQGLIIETTKTLYERMSGDYDVRLRESKFLTFV